MAAPWYFLARRDLRFDGNASDPLGKARGILAEHGLAEVFAGCGGRVSCFEIPNGPNGHAGTMLSVWPDRQFMPRPLRYDAESQRWVEGPQGVWCGASGTVEPESLSNGNPHRMSTVPILLSDGQEWEVPEVRRPSGESDLPRSLYFDKDGNLQAPVRSEWRSLWDEACWFFETLWRVRVTRTEREVTVPLARLVRFATLILSLRYRVCDATTQLLTLFDDVTVMDVVDIAIGWPALQWQRLREGGKLEELYRNPLSQAQWELWRNGVLPDHKPTPGEIVAASGAHIDE